MEDDEKMSVRSYCRIVLLIYILGIVYYAVVSRSFVAESNVRLDLFQGYRHPIDHSYKDIVSNIALFIPFGILVGMIYRRYRVVVAFVAGLLLTLAIECSQLIWHRGTFDVDDLFNNTVGAVIGGLFAMMVNRMIRSKKFGSING